MIEGGASPPAGANKGQTRRVPGAAARRALAEAAARRATGDVPDRGTAREVGGRIGPEPVRYGDWEVGGLATDF